MLAQQHDVWKYTKHILRRTPFEWGWNSNRNMTHQRQHKTYWISIEKWFCYTRFLYKNDITGIIKDITFQLKCDIFHGAGDVILLHNVFASILGKPFFFIQPTHGASSHITHWGMYYHSITFFVHDRQNMSIYMYIIQTVNMMTWLLWRRADPICFQITALSLYHHNRYFVHSLHFILTDASYLSTRATKTGMGGLYMRLLLQ